MPVEIRSLLEGLLAVTTKILRHFAALLSQVPVQRALVRVGPGALETGVRLLEVVTSYVSLGPQLAFGIMLLRLDLPVS